MSQKFQLTGSAITGIDRAHYARVSAIAPLPTQVCLGRIAPKARPQALRLSAYLQAGYHLPPLPVDWGSKATASIGRMYMNDTLGCCVISDAYHRVGVWTANESGAAVVGTDQEVVNTYRIWNPGSQDNGCVITDVLNYCRDHGISLNGVNHRIDGYVSVDWTNWDEVLVALYLFGTIPLGVNLPEAWLNSDTWDVTTSQIVGGHDIPAVAMLDAGGVNIASWGRLYRVTKAALTSRQWFEEAYAPLSPDWYVKAMRAPNLIDYITLKADLDKLGGGIIPDIGPVDPPPPMSNNRIRTYIPAAAHTIPVYLADRRKYADITYTEQHPIGVYPIGPRATAQGELVSLPPAAGKLVDFIVWLEQQIVANVPRNIVEAAVNALPIPSWEKNVLLLILAQFYGQKMAATPGDQLVPQGEA